MNESVEDFVTDTIEREERNRQVLSILLERQRERDGHLLALHSRMGEISAYVTTVDLAWAAQNIRFTADLPLFNDNADRLAANRLEATMEDPCRRRPDWRRQMSMTLYLATSKYRKFAPLLVVGYQRWINDENAEQWGADDRAMRNSLTVTPLEPRGRYCDLDTTATSFYILDGQHRLMAIHGLRDLLAKGQLHAMDADGNPSKNQWTTREEVARRIQGECGENESTAYARVETLMSERIGLEIVPAVSVGESYEDALFRLRRTFADIGTNAETAVTMASCQEAGSG
jgi:hypothetical protein